MPQSHWQRRVWHGRTEPSPGERQSHRPGPTPGRATLRPGPGTHGRRGHQGRAPGRRGNPLPRPLGQKAVFLLGPVQLRQRSPSPSTSARRRARRCCGNWSRSPTYWCRTSAPAPSRTWASATRPSRNSTPASSWSTSPPTGSSGLPRQHRLRPHRADHVGHHHGHGEEGMPPIRTGVPIIDRITALHAAIGALAA